MTGAARARVAAIVALTAIVVAGSARAGDDRLATAMVRTPEGWLETELPGLDWPLVAAPDDDLGPWRPGDVVQVPHAPGARPVLRQCHAAPDPRDGARCLAALELGPEPLELPASARRRAVLWTAPGAAPAP